MPSRKGPKRSAHRPRAHRLAVRILLALMLVAAALPDGSAVAQDAPAAPAFSNAEIAKAVDQVRADPNLGGTRTIRLLRWNTQPSRPWSLPDWLAWLGDLITFVAQSGRALFWIAIIALALLLVAYLVRVLAASSAAAGAGTLVAPTHVRDLDIRPESLPADVGAAARRLWDEGAHRAALALLYRGVLSRLAHVHHVPIRDSTTEGDCMALAAQHLSAGRHAYVVRLVTVWQRAVYGGRPAEQHDVYELCDAFGRSLDRADAEAGLGTSIEAPA